MIHTLPRTVVPAQEKDLGAYYTDAAVAEFLVQWAVRSGHEIILDPSFGGGAFIAAAADRLDALGGSPALQLYGVDLDAPTYERFVNAHADDLDRSHFLSADFFGLQPGKLPPVDVVVGNPPFIRYQRFAGRQRQEALACARRAGVTLSRLTSSWAPFLIHAAEFVKLGGRLGMVAPAELTHAGYARPVLDYLCRSFRHIQVLS